MTETLSFEVGDLVVRNGKILKVFKVKKDSVNLRPFFNLQTSNRLTFTLMLSHSHDGHIRRLVTKNKIGKLLNLIIKKPTAKKDFPAFDIKTALSENQLAKTLWAIKILWLEKQMNSGTLQGIKLSIFRNAMLQATEEIAAVNNSNPDQVKLLLLSDLKDSQKINSKEKKN